MPSRASQGLKKPQEFSDVYAKGKNIKTRNLVFLYTKNEIGTPRFGVVVSKKTCSRAVDRNTFKRLNRECFYTMFPMEKKPISYDVVVVAKKNVLGVTKEKRFSAFRQQWSEFLRCAQF